MKYQAKPVIVDAFKITESLPITGDVVKLGQFQLRLEGRPDFVVASPEMTARMTPNVGDYWVIQSDGYVYLNPKEVFERKYSPINDGGREAA